LKAVKITYPTKFSLPYNNSHPEASNSYRRSNNKYIVLGNQSDPRFVRPQRLSESQPRVDYSPPTFKLLFGQFTKK